MSSYDKLKVFAGNASQALAKDIVDALGIPLGSLSLSQFADGEVNLSINETVRGCDVFLVQATSKPVNDHLMELLVLIDACKRSSAARITCVMPYYGYARQDRRIKSRDPITAKLVADLITAAGADRVLIMELHSEAIQGFFNLPVDHIQGAPILVEYFKGRDLSQGVVVSPDVGAVKRSRAFAEVLDLPIAIIDKRRPRANEAVVANIIGDVKGKDCILVDDMIDTGGTLLGAGQALMDAGAASITAAASHGVFSGSAIEDLKASPFKEVIILDTIPLKPEQALDKITVLPTGDLLAKVINSIHEEQALTDLFQKQ